MLFTTAEQGLLSNCGKISGYQRNLDLKRTIYRRTKMGRTSYLVENLLVKKRHEGGTAGKINTIRGP
jgi:hypothetical protein